MIRLVISILSFVFVFGQQLVEHNSKAFKETVKKKNFINKKHNHTNKADSCLIRIVATGANLAPMYLSDAIGNEGILVGNNEILKEKVVIHFGEGRSQKAHRYNRTGTGGTYLYQDFVNVPFEIWNDAGTFQYHAIFRDFSSDSIWNLGSNHPYEYIWISSEAYSETASTLLSSYNNQTGSAAAFTDNFMYMIHLASDSDIDATNIPSAFIFIDEDPSPFISTGNLYLQDYTQGLDLYKRIGTDIASSEIVLYGCEFPQLTIESAPEGFQIRSDEVGNYLFWDTSAESALGDQTVVLKATNSHGEYSRSIEFGVVRGHSNNNIILNIGETGHFGRKAYTFFDFSRNVNVTSLYDGTIIVSSSDTKVSGELFNFNSFTNSSITSLNTSVYDNFDYGLNTRFNDSENESGLGIEIELNSSTKSTTPDADYVILDYKIKNVSASSIKDAYVGLSLDWDLIDAGANSTYLDSTSQIAYVFHNSDPENSPYLGVKILSRSVSGFNAFNNGDEASAMHSIVMSQIGEGKDGGDIRHQLSTGPYNLAVSENANVVFALISGSDLADLRTNGAAAQAVYDNQWNLSKYTHSNTNLTVNFADNGMMNNTFSYKGLGNVLASGTVFLSTSNENHVGDIYNLNQFRPTGHFENALEKYKNFETRRSVSFDDASATVPLGVHVKQTTYSQNSDSLGSALIIDYELTNTSGQALNDLLVSYFADFDILDYSTNTTRYDSIGGFAIAFNEGDTEVFGIDIIKGGKSAFAAIPNGAIPSNIHELLKNGTAELTSTDIRTLLSSGAFNLLPDDVAEVTFVIAAADNLTELRELMARVERNAMKENTDILNLAEVLHFLDNSQLNEFLSSDKVTYNEDSRIIGLDLSQFSLDSIPSSIGNLTYLESLIYYGSDDSGKSKQALENQIAFSENKSPILHRSESQIYNTNVRGKKSGSQLTFIDDAFYALPALKKVQIPNNIIPFEKFEKLFTIPSIEFIDVTNNQLSGDFPATFSQATKLIELHAGDNNITGEIPSSFSTHPDLRVFNLYFSHVSGSWPLSNWDREWKAVSIHGGSDLDIYMPNTSEKWQMLSNMWQFNFIGTIHGAVTADYAQLSGVEYLIIENKNSDTSTGLTGTFPSTFTSSSNLVEFFIAGHHELTGEIPESIGNLVNLDRLGIYDNPKMSGSIPSSIGNLVKLRALYLYNQNLSGPIPSSIGNLTTLNRLDLDQNHLNGVLPSSIGNLTNLKIFWLAVNQMSGALPTSIGNLTNLQGLYFYQNKFSGQLPSEMGQMTELRSLRLDENELTGSIPTSIASLNKLAELRLNKNQLSGSIPDGLANHVNLVALHFEENQFSGNLPNFWTSELRYINVFSNKLDIVIPSEIANASSLEYLYLSNNKSASIHTNTYGLNLIGFSHTSSSYPSSVENFGSSLERLHLNGFVIDSIPQSLVAALPNLKTLGISAKKLSSNVNTLASMENLYLHDKQAERLSPNIVGLEHLLKLEAIGGRLATIPDNYLNLPHLEFHVDSNRILASSLSEAMQLRFAELEGWTIDGQTPPVIGSEPFVTNIQPTSVTISLAVNQQETATLYYGLTTSFGETATVTDQDTIVFNLTNLIEQSTYHYKVVLSEGQPNEAESANFTFTTPSSDNTPPTFTSSVQFSTDASLSHFLTLYITANEELFRKPIVTVNSESIVATDVRLFNEAEHIFRVPYTAKTSGEKVFEFSGTDLNGNVGFGSKTLVLGTLTPNASKLVISPQIQLENAVRFSAESAVLVEKDAKADQTNVEFIQKTDALRIKRSGATHKLRLSVDLSDLKGADRLVNHAFYTLKGEEWTYLGGKLNGNRLEYDFEQAPSSIAVFWNKNQELIPTEFTLEQNFPNPFNPTTTIRFAVPRSGSVAIRIFNSLGQMVKILENKHFDTGYHSTIWNGLNSVGNKVPSGVYFYQIITSNSVQTKKMVMVK